MRLPLEHSGPAFSVVVSTLGRSEPILRLLHSLAAQTLPDFEVIIVDQNDDDRVASLIDAARADFPLFHIRTPQQRGLSRSRNTGWRRASGRYVIFADDDCWYPPWLLARAEQVFRTSGADFVSGRAVDEHGRGINARYEAEAQGITRANVWTTSIEWMIFLRREVLEATGGFDEGVGIGASTPWQAAEGQDLLLRALALGFAGRFDPSLHGFHAELDTRKPDRAMLGKARAYGRGMGFVLRRHGFGIGDLAYWLVRPAAGAILYSLAGQPRRGAYYYNVVMGRLEGWRSRSGAAGNAAPGHT
jgi:glycosyltransferase involved in cell wall biosynthesis